MSGFPVIHTERDRPRALPHNVTFGNLIRSNKRKSVVLIIGMTLLGVALGAALAAGITAYGGGGVEALIPSIVLGGAAAAVVAVFASMKNYRG